MIREDLSKVGIAVSQSIIKLLYFMFVWPLTVWLKSVSRIARMTDTGFLDLSRINSPWPIFVFYKRFFMEFLFDAFSVLTYMVGIIVAFCAFVVALKESFSAGVVILIAILLGTYYTPIFIAIMRDATQFFVIAPLRKFMSWITKPAQYVDINAVVKDKETPAE